MKLLIISLCVALASTQAPVNYTAPTNLQAQANINAIALFWEHADEEAAFLVTLSDGQSETTTERRIAFGGLEAATNYLATVAQANENGSAVSEGVSISIVTLSEGVRDLRVTEVAETSISVRWSALEDTMSYMVSIQEEGGDEIEAFQVEDTNVTFMGLEPLTSYRIMVRAGANGTEAGAATLTVRTDGAGVARIVATWQGIGGVFGGELKIFRPVNIPRGSYNIQVNFSCPIRSVKVWNAEFNEEESNLTAGLVTVTQSEIWELEKTDIGMTFYFASISSCSVNGTVPANFGVIFESINATTMPPVVETTVRVNVNEWFGNSGMVVPSAGSGLILLSETYDDPQPHLNRTNPKPLPGTFVIALRSGAGCGGGIRVQNHWSMTQKDTDGIQGLQPGVTYFVQDLTDWYNNYPGFVYGYDPRNCGNRDISAQVITGASFIDEIYNAPNV